MNWEDKYINKIVNIDCLEGMKELPDGCIDLVVTDPPYGLNYPYISYNDTPENLRILISKFMPVVKRICKRALIFSGVHNVQIYPQADWIISYSWLSTAKYGMAGYNQWQPILLYGKDIKGFGSVNEIIKSDTLHFTGGDDIGFLSSFKDKKHPCPKPLKVMKRVVNRFSNLDDLICDPFCGSGTTLVAAKELGRRFIGFEIEPKYCAIAEERLKQEVLNLEEK